MKKAVAFCLIMSMSVCILTGCKVKSDTPIVGSIFGLDNDSAFRIGDLTCSKNEYMLVLMNEVLSCKKNFGEDVSFSEKLSDDISLEDYVYNKAKESVTSAYALAAMANEKEIEFDQEEILAINNAAEMYYDSLSNEQKEYTGAEKSDVENLYTNYLLADKLYTDMTECYDTNISDEDARVIKVCYIRMNTSNTKPSSIKKTFKKVSNDVDNGANFSTQAKKYSEDAADEVTLKKNEAKKSYEISAFDLRDGELSSAIVDGDDYYLVYCMDSYMEEKTAANKLIMEDKAREKYFVEQYNEYIDNTWSDFNTSVVENIDLEFLGDVASLGLMDVYNEKVYTANK